MDDYLQYLLVKVNRIPQDQIPKIGGPTFCSYLCPDSSENNSEVTLISRESNLFLVGCPEFLCLRRAEPEGERPGQGRAGQGTDDNLGSVFA